MLPEVSTHLVENNDSILGYVRSEKKTKKGYRDFDNSVSLSQMGTEVVKRGTSGYGLARSRGGKKIEGMVNAKWVTAESRG